MISDYYRNMYIQENIEKHKIYNQQDWLDEKKLRQDLVTQSYTMMEYLTKNGEKI